MESWDSYQEEPRTIIKCEECNFTHPAGDCKK